LKSYLIDIEDFFQKLDDYLNNPEEMPVLTIGTARNMAKECRMQIVYDLDWNASENWKMMFRGNEHDKRRIQ
jgi:hypothetical protein